MKKTILVIDKPDSKTDNWQVSLERWHSESL